MTFALAAGIAAAAPAAAYFNHLSLASIAYSLRPLCVVSGVKRVAPLERHRAGAGPRLKPDLIAWPSRGSSGAAFELIARPGGI